MYIFSNRTLYTSFLEQARLLAVSGATILLVSTLQLPAQAQTTVPFTASPESSNSSVDNSFSDYSQAPEEQMQRLDAALLTLEDIAPLTLESTHRKDTVATLSKLSKIAEAYSRLNQQEKAIDVIEKAIAIAKQSFPEGYPYHTVQLAIGYVNIGEQGRAEALLKQSLEANLTTSSGALKLVTIASLANAYSSLGNAEVTEAGLATLVTLATDIDQPFWQNLSSQRRYVPEELIRSYGQLPNSETALEALSRLLEMDMRLAESPSASGLISDLSADRLSEFAKAYEQQGDTESAKRLLEQAMLILSDVKGRKLSQGISNVASAYGELEDTDTAEQSLEQLTERLLTREPIFERGISPSVPEIDLPIGFYIGVDRERVYEEIEPISSIAIAYNKLGNLEKAQELTAALESRIKALPVVPSLDAEVVPFEVSRAVSMLYPLSDIYKAIGDVPKQQVVLEEVFESLLTGEKIENVVLSEIGIGIPILLESYQKTVDDAIAQDRLSRLETLFRQVQFAELNGPGRLIILAIAVATRDEAAAHRLATEVMHALSSNTLLSQSERADGLSILTGIYRTMQNEQLRQEGLGALSAIATEIIEPNLREDVEGDITRAYARI